MIELTERDETTKFPLLFGATIFWVFIALISDVFKVPVNDLYLRSGILVVILFALHALLTLPEKTNTCGIIFRPSLIGGGLLLLVLIHLSWTIADELTTLSVYHLFVWLWYLLVFQLSAAWPRLIIDTSQLLALFVLLILWHCPAVLTGLINSNIYSFIIVGLLLSVEPASSTMNKAARVLGVIYFLALNRAGAVLALCASLLARAGARVRLASVLLLLTFLLYEVLSGRRSAYGRFAIWKIAWSDFLESPLIGFGTSWYPRYFFDFDRTAAHAHNILLSNLAQLGLISLIPLGIIMYAIVRDWRDLNQNTKGLVLAFGVWSLVDEPLWWIGSGTILFASIHRRQNVASR